MAAFLALVAAVTTAVGAGATALAYADGEPHVAAIFLGVTVFCAIAALRSIAFEVSARR